MGRKPKTPEPIEPAAARTRLGLRVGELAAALGYSRATIWRRVKAGRIKLNPELGVVTIAELKRLKLIAE